MPSQVVVFGNLTHHQMTRSDLMRHLQVHFPTLASGSPRENANPQPDFSIQFRDCITEFFCNSTTNFDFVITVAQSNTQHGRQQERAVAATESLVLACENLLGGLTLALRRPFTRRRPRLKLCKVQDPDSNSAILIRGTDSPLKSAGAKLSIGLAVFWLIVAGGLTWWQLTLHQTADSRRANILAIGLSLGVAAITTPVPRPLVAGRAGRGRAGHPPVWQPHRAYLPMGGQPPAPRRRLRLRRRLPARQPLGRSHLRRRPRAWQGPPARRPHPWPRLDLRDLALLARRHRLRPRQAQRPPAGP